jgi:hypothetical protein
MRYSIWNNVPDFNVQTLQKEVNYDVGIYLAGCRRYTWTNRLLFH